MHDMTWIPRFHRKIIDSLLKRGITHLFIVKIIMDEGETWRNQIGKLLLDRYGISVGSSSLQTKIFFQEKFGYIEKVREEHGIQGSQNRKIFKVTDKGEDLLNSGTKFLLETVKRLNY